jgi:periplasmic protein TonB
VVAAHVAVGWTALDLLESRRPIDPVPVTVTLLREPEPLEAVDTPPQPLPQKPVPVQPKARPPDPVREIEPEPRPVERIEPHPPPSVVEQLPPPPPPPVVAEPMPQPVPPPSPEPRPHAITQTPAPVPVPEAPPPVVIAKAEPPPAPVSEPLFAAAYLSNPTPQYPNLSRRLGEQGTVMLRVFVAATGDPLRIELKASCGYRRLDEAAENAVRRWKFIPAKRGEAPVDAWVVVPIKFTLKG